MGRTKYPSLSSWVPPASTWMPGAAAARSTARALRAKERSSMTAPPKFVRSSTGPYVSSSVVATSASRTPARHREAGT